MDIDKKSIARYVGLTLLASIIVGIAASILIAQGIDVNMSADIEGTAENMLGAKTRLRAMAYIGLLGLAFEAAISVGLYLLLKRDGPFLAGWALFISLAASVLMLLGAVYAMVVAQVVGNEAFAALTDQSGRKMLAGVYATSDYASYHLAIVVSSAAKAAFFYLFWTSGLIPKLISGWGLFVSLFVVVTIVARDFMPILGHNGITATFLISNLVAILSLGLYLAIKGTRRA